MAIGAIILVAIGSLLGLMSRQADRTAERTERLDVAGHALAALARDIGSIARARWAGPGQRNFVFAGLPDRMLFSLDRTDADRTPRSLAILLQGTETKDGSTVLRAEAPLSPLDREEAALDFAPAHTVYAGTALVRFAYVVAPGEGAPELLVDVWPAAETLPIAVRVAFTDPASGEILSSLRVPLRIEAEPGCAAPRKAFCSRIDPRSLEDQGEPGVPTAGMAAAGGR
ncbi:prepilin-type cleavage/methylation domain-containing protein [Methylobacterium sp. WL6]|uniref:PulJ/GspJ family protein n=1 Tax=Methylobacterium sp. WL6 TaxID=2603901 RepID=UPI00164F4778|nr:prepilin-type cleavage/methylation domain-containing protein [Methylobacterium sp. WL6]